MIFLIACSQQKRTDWRVSFDKNSKEPYGCYIAYHLLNHFFPTTKIESGRNLFTEIDRALLRKNSSSSTQRFSIIVCRDFQTDSIELDKIHRYIQQGNVLCVMAENFSENIFTDFNLQFDKVYPSHTSYYSNGEDTLANQQQTIVFNQREYRYHYTGLPIHYSFTIDSNFHDEYYYLGFAKCADTPNMRMRYIGAGTLMVCRNPITLTNHFILQGNNQQYIEHFFSSFNMYPRSVTWYSFYDRKAGENKELDLSWLLQFPPLFYAFLLIILLLLFYTLFESKRRQKFIPMAQMNTNSSLEFIETVGRLYFNKKDNKNLSEKMILHYFEHIRHTYNLKTNELNHAFITTLSQKTNHSFEETNAFVAYIGYIRDIDKISDIDIQHLYHQLKNLVSMETFSFENRIDIERIHNTITDIKKEIASVLVGQEDIIEMLLAAILSNGHILLEGVPGVAKTLTAKLIAKTIHVDFSRIQFTPDLMPSDVMGTNVFNPKNTSFEFRKGPIFSNIVLIDEINRAPAKTQSALFEVMEERSITVDGTSYHLAPPFMVIATQNPVEHEGTYQLPEAQLDRFAFKLIVDYPSHSQEVEILHRHQHQFSMHHLLDKVNKVIDADLLNELRILVSQVRVEDKLLEYIASIVHQTRNHGGLILGASPRGSITILGTSKAIAALRGRDFVTPDDIVQVSIPALRHRLSLSAEKEMEGVSTDDIIQEIVKSVEIPR